MAGAVAVSSPNLKKCGPPKIATTMEACAHDDFKANKRTDTVRRGGAHGQHSRPAENCAKASYNDPAKRMNRWLTALESVESSTVTVSVSLLAPGLATVIE